MVGCGTTAHDLATSEALASCVVPCVPHQVPRTGDSIGQYLAVPHRLSLLRSSAVLPVVPLWCPAFEARRAGCTADLVPVVPVLCKNQHITVGFGGPYIRGGSSTSHLPLASLSPPLMPKLVLARSPSLANQTCCFARD